MAQYDLLLTQNVAPSGVEFAEKYVNIAKGAILSGNAGGDPTVLAPGTDGYMLVRDDSEATGLKWQIVSGGHTQNTDTGTTSQTFELDSDGFQIELTAESASKFGVKVNGGATYADLEAKDITANAVAFTSGTITTAPTGSNDIVNKAYADAILAANDAMVYKGVIDASTNPNYPAADAGHTYRISVAGLIGGASGVAVEAGDWIICNTDATAAGDQATVGANWGIIQANLDGAVIGPASAVNERIAVYDGTTGKLLKDSGALVSDLVAKTLFDANTVLAATADNTPTPLTINEQTFVGRKTGGNIAALSPAEAMNILWVTAPPTMTSTGTAGQIAKDDNWFYICTATNTWKRTPIATTWS